MFFASIRIPATPIRIGTTFSLWTLLFGVIFYGIFVMISVISQLIFYGAVEVANWIANRGRSATIEDDTYPEALTSATTHPGKLEINSTNEEIIAKKNS